MKKISVVLMIVLSTLTLGIYPYAWLYSTGQDLCKQAPRELYRAWFVFWGMGFYVLDLTLTFILIFNHETGAPHLLNIVESVSDFMMVGSIVFSLLAVFQLRRLVLAAAKGKSVEPVSANWFLTLFFKEFYLQYKINRLIEQNLLTAHTPEA